MKLEIKQKRILIAEDEKAYFRALFLKCKNAGFDVEGVENGEQALAAVKSKHFDLVLCDLVMPKMNGFEFLEEVKRQQLNIPVIVLSNLTQGDDEKKVREAGAVDFISKSNTAIVDVILKVENFFIKK